MHTAHATARMMRDLAADDGAPGADGFVADVVAFIPKRGGGLRLGEMEKENTALRAEYNLQSLKQEMLVHMWSMHMLDADAEDDAST